MNKDLVTYYHDRASEYDKIYERPERQDYLSKLSRFLVPLFKDQKVYEIACGTGYWTEKISISAQSVLATDINDSVLDIARGKSYPNGNVIFQNESIFHSDFAETYDALFGGFIWSHILREQLSGVLQKVINSILPGGLIVFTDNIFQPGNSTAISEVDSYGNTFQHRTLENGSSHLVLKNFMSEELLMKYLKPFACNVRYYDFKYYWVLTGEKTG